MPRASRHYLPGHVWHLTHRCHRQQFLLRFAKDRRRWVHWLYEARRRYQLCVLDYVVTSNHIHLVVRDRGRGEIARSMQLIAGRTGQEYNQRKRRSGAFWEDRYHATAVETGEHLARCVIYVDLNMVRAGVVAHPAAWETAGYHEIHNPPARFRIIDRSALAEALGLPAPSLSGTHAEWVDAALASGPQDRRPEWSTSVAVGSHEFVERVESDLGARACGRAVQSFGGAFRLHDPSATYGHALAGENAAPSS
jgi:putative transposase